MTSSLRLFLVVNGLIDPWVSDAIPESDDLEIVFTAIRFDWSRYPIYRGKVLERFIVRHGVGSHPVSVYTDNLSRVRTLLSVGLVRHHIIPLLESKIGKTLNQLLKEKTEGMEIKEIHKFSSLNAKELDVLKGIKRMGIIPEGVGLGIVYFFDDDVNGLCVTTAHGQHIFLCRSILRDPKFAYSVTIHEVAHLGGAVDGSYAHHQCIEETAGRAVENLLNQAFIPHDLEEVTELSYGVVTGDSTIDLEF